jgi:hypothetical protein
MRIRCYKFLEWFTELPLMGMMCPVWLLNSAARSRIPNTRLKLNNDNIVVIIICLYSLRQLYCQLCKHILHSSTWLIQDWTRRWSFQFETLCEQGTLQSRAFATPFAKRHESILILAVDDTRLFAIARRLVPWTVVRLM